MTRVFALYWYKAAFILYTAWEKQSFSGGGDLKLILNFQRKKGASEKFWSWQGGWGTNFFFIVQSCQMQVHIMALGLELFLYDH